MRKTRVLAERIEYLDPADAGSFVGYTIYTGVKGLRGSVDLADCNRRIEWYFDKECPIAKIDKAIEIFQDFRRRLMAARKRR